MQEVLIVDDVALQTSLLGFDLPTQQLKAVAITSDLDIVYAVEVDFNFDLPTYGAKKAVYIQEEEYEVFAPIAMWLEAVDLLLERLRQDGMVFDNVKSISGAGQQHGSVFWTGEAEQILRRLNLSKSLLSHISDALASPPGPLTGETRARRQNEMLSTPAWEAPRNWRS
jgi:xylulokinase